MRSLHRFLYWIEVGAALLSAFLAVLSVLWKDWIELLFDVDPDNGSGALEFGLALAFAAVALILSLVARRQHRVHLSPT